jgi:hypothetical protein
MAAHDPLLPVDLDGVGEGIGVTVRATRGSDPVAAAGFVAVVHDQIAFNTRTSNEAKIAAVSRSMTMR